MKFRILVILILTSRFSFSQGCCDDKFLKYPLKSILFYCQEDTSKIFSRQELTYNNDKKIATSSLIENEKEISRTVYNYDSNGLLISKDLYGFIPELKLKRTRVYKYNPENKLIYEGFDDTKANNTINHYKYDSNGLLTNSTLECNYNNWKYRYEYDSNGLLIKKFKNNKLEFFYEYREDRLIKKTNFTTPKEIVVTFKYDINGNISVKKENDKVVEQNIYMNGLLVKRWTYYYGIDPCYDRCCRQYFVEYNYY